MKTTIALTIAVLVSSLTIAHPLTEGSYKGQGIWKSEKTQGQYKQEVVITAKKIQTKYLLADETIKEWNFDIKETMNGHFEVLTYGVKLGSGYCLDKAPVCHYEISVGSLNLEETLVQEGNKVYRFGSKNEGQGAIMWQESLELNLSDKE